MNINPANLKSAVPRTNNTDKHEVGKPFNSSQHTPHSNFQSSSRTSREVQSVFAVYANKERGKILNQSWTSVRKESTKRVLRWLKKNQSGYLMRSMAVEILLLSAVL